MEKFNFNYLKIILKTEIKWLLNSKKTILLILIGFVIPLIPSLGGDPIIKILPEKTIPLFAFILGIAASVCQYFLDSTLKDIITKVNHFYLNFQVNNSYILIAKIITTLPLFFIFLIFNLLFYKVYMSISIFIFIIMFYINISIYTYLLVAYFYDSKSLLFSTYIPLIFFVLLFIPLFLLNLLLNITIQAFLILLGLKLLKYLQSTKKVLINSL